MVLARGIADQGRSHARVAGTIRGRELILIGDPARKIGTPGSSDMLRQYGPASMERQSLTEASGKRKVDPHERTMP
ncbi:MAG: hypothetical protein AAGJ83_11735 [Planctomycetota bacterium]